jgi:hypothetical protein
VFTEFGYGRSVHGSHVLVDISPQCAIESFSRVGLKEPSHDCWQSLIHGTGTGHRNRIPGGYWYYLFSYQCLQQQQSILSYFVVNSE